MPLTESSPNVRLWPKADPQKVEIPVIRTSAFGKSGHSASREIIVQAALNLLTAYIILVESSLIHHPEIRV
jgi:hypothetical protein